MKRPAYLATLVLSTILAAPSQYAIADENLLLNQLHTLDFNKCRSTAETLAGVLVDTGNHGYSAKWGPDISDDMLLYTVENTFDDGSSNITVGAVAPTSAGDCDVVRTKVLALRQTCSALANDWELNREGTLNSKWVKYSDEGNSTDTFMLSFGGGCVVKQVEHVVGMPKD